MQVQCQILSESEKQVIHEQSLRILEEIGVMFHSKKARQILSKHCAMMDDENGIVRIPADIPASSVGAV